MNYTESSLSNGGSDDEDVKKELSESGSPSETPKKAGRRKINIEFIEDKSRRHITFSKRKAGIMKKAYELSTLTGTQVLLLVASETGHVYTFATPKLQPLITKPDGKNLIQSCLNAPESNAPSTSSPPHHSVPGRLAQTPYNSEAPMIMPTRNTPAPQQPQQAQQDQNKPPFHIDVAQMNNHLGLTYGGPFPNSNSNPLNMISNHSLNMSGLNSYPSNSIPGRYMPNPPTSHPPTVSSTSNSSSSANGNGQSGSNQYPPSNYPSSVAGMMAQFPATGGPNRFGGTNPAFMWAHGVNNSSTSNQHSDGKHSGSDSTPREEGLQSKD